MFYYCKALESLDIRNFDMGNVTKSDYMFSGVGELYWKATRNKTSIQVTMALRSVLESKNVSTGGYAEYFIVDNMPR